MKLQLLCIYPTHFYSSLGGTSVAPSSFMWCDIIVTSFFVIPESVNSEFRIDYSFFPYLNRGGFVIHLRNSYVVRKRNSVNNSKKLTPNDREIDRIAKLIDCPVEIVRHCMLQIGPSVPAIDAYWQMNKDRLMIQCCKKTMDEVKRELKVNTRLPNFSF